MPKNPLNPRILYFFFTIFAQNYDFNMNWQQLISNKRLGQEEWHLKRKDDRTEFKRDYDRLIFSAPFRRLQNKTQVFPLPGSVFVHNREKANLEAKQAIIEQMKAINEPIVNGEPWNAKQWEEATAKVETIGFTGILGRYHPL